MESIKNNEKRIKKISSVTTPFRKNILPVILIVNVLVLVILINYFNYAFKDLTILFFVTIIFAFAWFTSFRKLQVVYLGNNFLKVKEEKILFKDILAIDRKSSFTYKVTYQFDDEVNSFIFMVDCLPFLVPSFVKEIKEHVKGEIKRKIF